MVRTLFSTLQVRLSPQMPLAAKTGIAVNKEKIKHMLNIMQIIFFIITHPFVIKIFYTTIPLYSKYNYMSIRIMSLKSLVTLIAFYLYYALVKHIFLNVNLIQKSSLLFGMAML